jgi:hypothetical protein
VAKVFAHSHLNGQLAKASLKRQHIDHSYLIDVVWSDLRSVDVGLQLYEVGVEVVGSLRVPPTAEEKFLETLDVIVACDCARVPKEIVVSGARSREVEVEETLHGVLTATFGHNCA